MRDTNSLYKGYTVEPPIFLVVDSINYFSPLFYTLDDFDMKDAIDGFEYNNRIYPGVTEILKNLAWSKDHDTWNISRVAAEAGGVVKLRYDS
jgi:hypothetical protein